MSDRDLQNYFNRREDDELDSRFARRLYPHIVKILCDEIDSSDLQLKMAIKKLVEHQNQAKQRRSIAIGAIIVSVISGLGAWIIDYIRQMKL